MAEEPADMAQTEAQIAEGDDSAPAGNHALEVAARAGFGPLSPRAQEVWHGQAVPCVSCGQLVHRDDPACDHCGQDLSEEMIRKMRQHAGPWFVLEHVRPFPGVSLERVVRQIRRGLITETSIVRGPSNDFQWRFAVETPGLCRYFGKCWCCHGSVTLSDTYCPQCLHNLSFEKPRPVPQMSEGEARQENAAVGSPTAAGKPILQAAVGEPARPPTVAAGARMAPGAGVPQSLHLQSPVGARSSESADLARLSAAVRQARVTRPGSEWDQPPRVGGVNVSWIAALLIIAAVVALLLISRARTDRPAPVISPALPAMQPAPVAPVRSPDAANPPAAVPPGVSPTQGPAPAVPTDPPRTTSGGTAPGSP